MLLLPGKSEPTDLERYLPAPLRKRAYVTLIETASLIQYVNTHKTAGTHLFGEVSETGGKILAVLDYHSADKAQWANHRAALELRPTPEWARWIKHSNSEKTQREFAEYLEENASDIVVPPTDPKAPNSTQMLDVALTLQARTDVQFSSATRLSNGQTQLTYNEQIQAGAGADGRMTIPEVFYLSVAPFVGTPRYLVKARLKYRLGGGKLAFRYEIERPHKIVEDAFRDIRQTVETETGFKLHLGSVN
jgi:uncharacterized protein YfdQ (DUF2303 family)